MQNRANLASRASLTASGKAPIATCILKCSAGVAGRPRSERDPPFSKKPSRSQPICQIFITRYYRSPRPELRRSRPRHTETRIRSEPSQLASRDHLLPPLSGVRIHSWTGLLAWVKARSLGQSHVGCVKFSRLFRVLFQRIADANTIEHLGQVVAKGRHMDKHIRCAVIRFDKAKPLASRNHFTVPVFMTRPRRLHAQAHPPGRRGNRSRHFGK
jgi:hypothetical protein